MHVRRLFVLVALFASAAILSATDVLMEYSCDENNLGAIMEGAIKIWKIPEDID